MIELVERQDIVKFKIKELLKFVDENELTYCSNDLKILVHEIKGLCGLFGYGDLFILFYEIEKTILSKNFEMFKYEIEKLKQYNLEVIKENNITISCRHVYKYEICFYFTNIKRFNEIINLIGDCTIIVHSKMCNNKIILYVLSYCDINTIKLLSKSYLISVKERAKFPIRKKDNFLSYLCRNSEHFDNNYLHLFLLESIANIAKIADKKFKFTYKSNNFILNNNFLSDFYIVFTELIKNIFSHSGRKDFELVTIKCFKNNKYILIETYNRGNKIKKKYKSNIFENHFSTSKLNGLSGQGIGLYDVNRLLSHNNGKIHFKNRFRGVSFFIKIPVSKYCVKLSNH
ncbi:MAG: sensor histidine kinase [Erysipelotrichales bacterium]|nr:sensor histidine kinase [Erysipelotrichales bacterium]